MSYLILFSTDVCVHLSCHPSVGVPIYFLSLSLYFLLVLCPVYSRLVILFFLLFMMLNFLSFFSDMLFKLFCLFLLIKSLFGFVFILFSYLISFCNLNLFFHGNLSY